MIKRSQTNQRATKLACKSTGALVHSSSGMGTRSIGLCALLLLLVAAGAMFLATTARAQDADSVIAEDADLVERETHLLWLVNIERDKQGIPPLRWNRELSEAARWFAKDSVDGEAALCDHLDSNNEGLGMRMRRFGYSNPVAFGELIVCGFVEPDAAVYGWQMNPEDDFKQRKLMLDPRFREAGVAYHYSSSAERGMVGLNLSGDLAYAPVVIDLEAPTTADATVSLYVYPTQSPPVSIKISNSPVFEEAAWQPYSAKVEWTLQPGSGWRTVYVLTRDSNGETTLATDSIWLGDGLPQSEVSLEQATNIGVGYAMDHLPNGEGKKVRLSLGWEYDDKDDTFGVIRGESNTVDDSSAVGGSALHLGGDDRESLIHSRLLDLPANRILTLYVRAKVDAVQELDPLFSLTVNAGEFTFGPMLVRASDFAAANQWQEIPIDFILPIDANPAEVDLEVAHTGAQQLWLDTLRIFSQPIATNQTIIWPVYASDQRGRAVQARYEDGDGLGEPFDIAYREVDALPAPIESHKAINALPSYLAFRSMDGVVESQGQVVIACEAWCASVKWEAKANAPWLRIMQAQEGLIVYFDSSGLVKGAYQETIFLQPVAGQNSNAAVGDPASNGAENTGGFATATTPGGLLQTWIIVSASVDGAEPLPPREVLQAMWLPIARQR